MGSAEGWEMNHGRQMTDGWRGVRVNGSAEETASCGSFESGGFGDGRQYESYKTAEELGE